MQAKSISAWLFQSTPPCGGDPSCFPAAVPIFNFNPRPHAGATGRCAHESPGRRISIHAPMRGRPEDRGLCTFEQIFQSTPPCGGDHSWFGFCVPVVVFQSTPPCGGDPEDAGNRQGNEISIHAPMRGRLPTRWPPSWACAFQSTPPCGGDIGHIQAK